jgi:hypothetical protein
MKTAFVLICAAILLLTFATPVMAENVKMKDNPKCKNWDQLIGKWSWELEARESPTGPVERISGTEEYEWMYDGMFIKRQVQRTNVAQGAIEIIAYDPILKTHVSAAFHKTGQRWLGNSGGWKQRTLVKNVTHYIPDGQVLPETCVLSYSSDFTSLMVECKRYSEGQWWVAFKGKGTKLK